MRLAITQDHYLVVITLPMALEKGSGTDLMIAWLLNQNQS